MHYRTVIFQLLLLLGLGPALADELLPFHSDGCSLFPDGTFKNKTLWNHCCIAHDKAYWLGGNYDERLLADEALRACVAQAGEPRIADLMRRGVRAGGGPQWPTPYRWGYGWSTPRGYRELSDEERARARVLLEQGEPSAQ